jgi:DNA end-binding protein Ku
MRYNRSTMSARALASATVSFGLVSIPVKLYSATAAASGVSFNLLHKKCGSRLKQQYLCVQDNEKVERDDMIKGYEFAKDRYVTFTPEELKALEEKPTQTVEIAEFVPAARIDPIYFDKPYYLGPDKGGDKAYKLLVQAMLETGRVGLARYAARGKQYLVMLRPSEGRLVMQQLLYADEIRQAKEVPVGDSEVKEAELKLATLLIEQISRETFDPGQYEDDVKKRILDVIEKKVAGQEVQIAPPEQQKAQIIDIMEALKASLNKKGDARAAAPASAAAPSAEAASGDEADDRKPARRAQARSSSERAKLSKK